MSIQTGSLIKESRERYITYALSVVSSRALPDVRDGLKPVQRRIIYAMFNNLNLKPTGNHKKSAAVVGEVLAKYHPHGDIPCYEAMARMAQDFSLRYPILDGQGNFGSLDGDPPAAYRYTEIKLRPIALDLLGEIEEETVSFTDNFDASVKEPTVLPSRIPNLLINGVTGIAVGMATSIPPHNFKEVITACVALLENSELKTKELLNYIKGPDFPIACLILNTRKELEEIYESGKGAVRMRSDWKLEELGRGKKAIIITAIPYQINKANLVEKIAEIIIDKKLPQLTDIRDESTDQIRVVLELANQADPEIALAYLYKHTALESNFSVNLTGLVSENGVLIPEELNLKRILEIFLDFRKEVVAKRLNFEKKNLEARVHILEGFKIIFDHLDEAIKIVRKSTGRSDAANKLTVRFKLTEIQAFAIVDLRIYQLSKTNIEEIITELKAKQERILEIVKILKSKALIQNLVKKDLELVNANYGDSRRSKIIKSFEENTFDKTDYLVKEDVYALISKDGWLKRIRQTNSFENTRVREGDEIMFAHVANTLDTIIIFTNQAYFYTLNVADFPASSGFGEPVQKLLKFKDAEKIVASFVLVPDVKEALQYVLVSEQGIGASFNLETDSNTKKSGKKVMKLKGADLLAGVAVANKQQVFVTKQGYGLLLNNKMIPERNAGAMGAKLIGLRAKDQVIGIVSNNVANITLTNNSKKAIKLAEIKQGKRAQKGNKLFKTGNVAKVN